MAHAPFRTVSGASKICDRQNMYLKKDVGPYMSNQTPKQTPDKNVLSRTGSKVHTPWNDVMPSFTKFMLTWHCDNDKKRNFVRFVSFVEAILLVHLVDIQWMQREISLRSPVLWLLSRRIFSQQFYIQFSYVTSAAVLWPRPCIRVVR